MAPARRCRAHPLQDVTLGRTCPEQTATRSFGIQARSTGRGRNTKLFFFPSCALVLSPCSSLCHWSFEVMAFFPCQRPPRGPGSCARGRFWVLLCPMGWDKPGHRSRTGPALNLGSTVCWPECLACLSNAAQPSRPGSLASSSRKPSLSS